MYSILMRFILFYSSDEAFWSCNIHVMRYSFYCNGELFCSYGEVFYSSDEVFCSCMIWYSLLYSNGEGFYFILISNDEVFCSKDVLFCSVLF